MYNFIIDEYRDKRGGTSRVLDVTCSACRAHIAYYQKDGPGILKRMYIDRFIDRQPIKSELTCFSCNQVIGTKVNYTKENRTAYRLFVGAVNKKIVSKDRV